MDQNGIPGWPEKICMLLLPMCSDTLCNLTGFILKRKRKRFKNGHKTWQKCDRTVVGGIHESSSKQRCPENAKRVKGWCGRLWRKLRKNKEKRYDEGEENKTLKNQAFKIRRATLAPCNLNSFHETRFPIHLSSSQCLPPLPPRPPLNLEEELRL